MRLILESNSNLNIINLPFIIDGNYWIINNNKNLLNVEAKLNKWVITSNEEVKLSKVLNNNQLSNVNYLDEVILEENKYY